MPFVQTRYATVGSDGGGPSPWSNPTEGVRQGGAGTYADVYSGSSNLLIATGFGFTLPGGALVTGVSVRWPSLTLGQPPSWWTGTVRYLALYGVAGAVYRDPGVGLYPTIVAGVGGGGEDDRWGAASIPAAVVNAASFGTALQVSVDPGAPGPENRMQPVVNGNVVIAVFYLAGRPRALMGVGH